MPPSTPPSTATRDRPTGDPTIPDEVLARAMAGEPDAVAHVLEIIRGPVVRYCRARIPPDRSFAGADDVAQDVCLAVLTALPRFHRRDRSFLAFVFGIAAHKVVDAHRQVVRRRTDPVDQVPDSVAPGRGPEELAVAWELSDELGRLLDALPPRQREVVVLRVAAGLSAEETALAVGSTAAAVRVAQHRALVRLREATRVGAR
jgi:RNA polymerase sigma-70 factor (ECF subfamily)